MAKDFENQSELTEWLEASRIEMGVWGTGSVKTIDNLWDEYMQGEVTFEAYPPLRMVQVVQVLIQQNDRTLFEIEQVLNKGMRRFRNQPPAEKIKRCESGIDAAYRCLNEELGLSRDQVSFMAEEQGREEMVIDSPSYPGLPTCYKIQKIKVHVTGLPDEEFWRENKAARDGDPVRRHLWAWR